MDQDSSKEGGGVNGKERELCRDLYKDEINTTMTYTVALEPTQEMTAYKLASLLKTELEEILGVKYEFIN